MNNPAQVFAARMHNNVEQVADLSRKEIDINGQIELVGRQIRHMLDQKGLLKNILGIVACGSLARGEGLIAKYNDGVKILSDLDLALISQDRRISAYRISAEIWKISKFLRSSFKVSLGVIKPRDFSASRTLLFLDIKQSGKVLFGNKRLLNAIDIEVNNVPLWEGVRLLFNNGVMPLLQVFNYDKEKGPLETVHACDKAYLACCDALLLLSGAYPPTISQRSELFEKVYSRNSPTLSDKIPFLVERVKQSAEIRTQSKPWNMPRLSDHELSKMWFEARKACVETLQFYLTQYFGFAFQNPDVFAKMRVLSPRRRASMAYQLLKGKKPLSVSRMLLTHRSPMQAIYEASLFLLKGISQDNSINPEHLQSAHRILHPWRLLDRFAHKKSLTELWLANRNRCLELWKSLPQIIICMDSEFGIESVHSAHSEDEN